MKLLKHRTLFLIILIISSISSCSNDTNSIQVTNWEKLHVQDDLLKSILHKNGWKPIQIPSIFKLPHSAPRTFRFVWLRGKFDVKDNPSQYYGISTGKILYTDKIYINNNLIGSQSLKKITWTPTPRNYIVPDGIIKKGKNIVYIQIGIYGRYDGGILDSVLIQPEEIFDRTQFVNNLIYTYLPYGLVVILTGFLISLLIIFLWDRKQKLPLHASLGLLAYIIYMLSCLSTNKQVSYESYLVIAISIIPLFFISFILCIQSIYRVYFSNYNRVIIPVFLIFVVIMILFRNYKYNYQIAFLLTNITLLVSIPYLMFLIYRSNSINPDKFLFNMIIIIFIISSSVMVFEFYSEYFGGHYSDIVATLSPLVFLIIFAVLFSREIIKRRIELESIYNKLKRYELQFDGHEKELSITESAEEKLKRIIDFIDENYTRALSREGLASAVGINPNYMGILFKTYTGIAVHEYINKLRIDEAIRKLKSGNSKIIDIAYSVGFENSVTFNRVFKKVTGKTPSEFKNNN